MAELTGTVYTETVVFSPPEAYINDVPYQLAIIQFETGKRTTARIAGERASIGDRVVLKETRGYVQYFEKQP
jgi:uncharacterized OB-fold protein